MRVINKSEKQGKGKNLKVCFFSFGDPVTVVEPDVPVEDESRGSGTGERGGQSCAAGVTAA